MQLIIDEIRRLTASLAGLRPDSIVIDNLDDILSKLQASDLAAKIACYNADKPSSSIDEKSMEKQQERMRSQADLINKAADLFLDELERIKTIRQTLNQEALDPIIKEARAIIHSLHAFTAQLEEGI
ncbi:MAG: hypothetical protein ACRC2O_13255 [Chitinophagaceae bacterium]